MPPRLLFGLLALSLLAGCTGSPVEDVQEGALREDASRGNEPVTIHETVSLTEGANNLRWSFHLRETAPSGHVRLYLDLVDGAEAAQEAEYCMKYRHETERGQETIKTCSEGNVNLQVSPPVALRAITVLDLDAPFARGDYHVTFDAPPQANRLHVDIEIPADAS